MALHTAKVVELCMHELQRFESQAPADDRLALEFVNRAIAEQADEAWSALQECFHKTIRVWLRSHPNCELALQLDTEENYVAQTFSRFWHATRTQQIAFASLSAVLAYLHATLGGVIIDTLRFHLRSCAREVPLPEPGLSNEPTVEGLFESEHLWLEIQKLLHDQHERRLFSLLYFYGLKPREIVARCPQEFPEVKDIYRLNKNIVDKLRRNSTRLRYLMGFDECM